MTSELPGGNVLKIAVALVFVIFASGSCALAVAQDAAQLSEATLRLIAPPEHGLLLAAAEGGGTNSVGPEDHLQPALSTLFADPTTSALDKQQSATPAGAISQDNGLCGLGPICSCNSCPCFYVEVEALFLARQSLFNHQNVVVDPNTGRSFLSTADVDLGFDPGLRITAGMRICGGMALEVSYFGLFGGNASASATKPDPDAFLTLGGNLVGNVFVDMSGVQMTDSSWVQSIEINLPCCCGCCDDCRDACGCGELRCQSFEWFGGFRYLVLGDDFNIAAERIVSGAVEEGSYNIRTVNQLFGVQAGARWRRTWGRVGWEATGKVGIYANDMEETQTVTDFPNFPLRPTVSGSEVGVAFVGELDLSALYRLTDVWNLKAGYTLIAIQGLALGPDQLDFNFAQSPSGNEVHNGGGMILQGLNVGVEARW
jgi:hypothetical protein